MSESQKQSVQKKGRKRFKDLFHRIRQQMEFYFSDANLHKDRFLKQKITESTDGYVDISLFLRFNKIRELVTETEPLIKALCQSQLLEVNEEKTAIRRVEPLTEATDVDERTVYVECLPAHVDHAWIKKIFSACGRVVYISLPKFHSTKDIKGFAFVEFENIAEAQTACQMMNNPPASVVEKRPGKFPRGSKDILRMSRQLQTGNVRKRRASESLLDNEQNNKTTKRRRTRSEGHDLVNSDECIKQAESLEPEQSPVTQSLQATTGSKMAASGGSGNMAATGGNIEGTVQLSKERKRKRAKVEFEAAEEVESVLKRVKEDADSVDVTADKTADESLASIDSSAADKTADESLASIDSSAAAVKRCKKVEMSVEEPDRKRKELEQGEENKNKKRKKRHGKDKNKTMFNIPELRVISNNKMSESQKQSVQKKGRKRFKDLFHRIRQQMEFYFSDANLHKDRFLKQKITESTDGYVDISLFLRFNKIRELVTETEPLIKALCQSQLLEVNEEKTAIRRVEPLTEATDVDERTVYVECLPAHVDHAWIKKIFSACGRVVYISLPKFHSTKDIKGFAFVEFENIAEAQTACQMMNNPPASVVEKRPGKFPRGSKDILRMSRQLQTGNVRKRRASESLLDNEQNNKTTKRRRTRSEGHDLVNSDECIKQAESLEPEQSPVTQSLQATTGSKMAASGGSGNMAATGGNIEGTVQLSKERKRKRAKVEFEAAEEVESVLKRVKEDADSVDVTADKTADESLASIDSSAADKTADESLASIDSSAAAVKRCKKVEMSVEEPDRKRKELEQGEENKNKKRKKRHGKDKNKTMFNIPELRVISKREWLELRSEYLQLQKANMSQLKQSLKALKQTTQQQQQQQQHVSKPVAAAAAECDLVTNSLEFTPNVIVHVTSQQPLCRKQLKTELSAAGTIAYFDVQDGAMEAYLRCADALSAAAIVRCDLPGYTMSLLSGDDEHDYWLKATNDRLKKLGTKSKQVKKHRGRDKVLKQAEKADMTQRKHITFDD